jgi:dimethylargininase
MFKNAIVRKPSARIIKGLSSVNMGKPDYLKALEQHQRYIETLRICGLEVKIMDANPEYPDSTFIEDIALCTPHFAVIANPGALSRQGETEGIKMVLQEFFKSIEEIISPGTLEAGDVMMIGNHFFIGMSDRTNNEGADQLILILKKYGMTGSKIPLFKLLHLKSGVSYLENNNMLVSGELINNKEFGRFNLIRIDDEESYAANSLWINGTVIVPEGFPKTTRKIEKAGYETITLDVSEFRKIDGGLSCLSLRF